MLAAMVQIEDQVWFFKAMGPAAAIEAIAPDFRTWLNSVTWNEGTGEPRWELPTDWTQAPGDAMRYATLQAGSNEITISKLRLNGPWEAYVESNANRWRGQLGLPPVSAAEVMAQSEAVTLAGRSGLLFDWQSESSAGTGPQPAPSNPPPATATVPPKPPASPTSSAPPSTSSSTSGLTYDVPEGWTPGRAGPFRLAAFEVSRDNEQLEITVTALGTAAGSLRDNVNRWRGQIGLSPLEGEGGDPPAATLAIAGADCPYFEMSGPDSDPQALTLLAVVIPRSNATIFVKLLGSRPLAAAEKGNFEQFVRSIRFDQE
jgi:hypothetical protein